MQQYQTGENKRIYSDVFLLGFLLLGAQIILVREFLIIFNGNELVIGILFSIWMFSNALGAWVGRFVKPTRNYTGMIRLLLVFIAVYPVAAAFGMEYFRNTFFEVGRMISFYGIIFYSLLVLLPLCFAGGFAFSLINISTSRNPGSLQNCYSYESAGSLTGGVITSLLFIYYLNSDNFSSLNYLALVAFIHFALTEFRWKKYFISLLYLMGAIGIMLVVYSYDLDRIARERLFSDQEVLRTHDTPYGSITFTRQHSQVNIYLDGQLLYSEDEPVKREEDVHYTMLQRQQAGRVLMIGGAVTGGLEEVKKYPEIELFRYVDQNRMLHQLAMEMGIMEATEAVEIYYLDPIYFLKNNTDRYDVILVSQPPPLSAQFNRLYTTEFFAATKKVLSAGGVLSVSLPSSRNYLSDDELMLHSSIYNSLGEVFTQILLVPGERYYFLASDSVLTMSYNALLAMADIQNTYVNDAYIDENLLEIRSAAVVNSYLDSAPLNRNFQPAAYSIFINHWLSYFGISFWIIPFVCLAVALAFYVLTRSFSTAMFTSGITGVATELILIVVFQALFGNVYIFIGIIITTFMAGLAFGSRLSMLCKSGAPTRMMHYVQLFSGIYILSIAMTIYFIGDMSNMLIVKVIFIFAMFVLAAFTGLQYGVSVCQRKIDPGVVVSEIYASDLVGAAIGSLVVTVWLIPMIGVYQSVFILAALHFLTLVLLYLKRK